MEIEIDSTPCSFLILFSQTRQYPHSSLFARLQSKTCSTLGNKLIFTGKHPKQIQLISFYKLWSVSPISQGISFCCYRLVAHASGADIAVPLNCRQETESG